MYINKRKQQELISKMTNWQRKQWAGAGYPVTKDDLEKYLNMKKPAQVDNSKLKGFVKDLNILDDLAFL